MIKPSSGQVELEVSSECASSMGTPCFIAVGFLHTDLGQEGRGFPT